MKFNILLSGSDSNGIAKMSIGKYINYFMDCNVNVVHMADRIAQMRRLCAKRADVYLAELESDTMYEMNGQTTSGKTIKQDVMENSIT